MRIAVLGTGYRGATHAACLAHLHHEMVGVDLDDGRIGTLAGGRAVPRAAAGRCSGALAKCLTA